MGPRARSAVAACLTAGGLWVCGPGATASAEPADATGPAEERTAQRDDSRPDGDQGLGDAATGDIVIDSALQDLRDAPAGDLDAQIEAGQHVQRTLHRVTIIGDRPVGVDGRESELIAGRPFLAESAVVAA